MSLAESVAMSAAAFLGLVAIGAYLIDWAGAGLQPWLVVGIAALMTLALASRSRPAASDGGDLIAFLGIVMFLAAMFLRLSWPSLLPPGRGPDLTHHLLLVDYIQQTGHLVHDRSLDGSMGEMAHYTPAAHLLAVIAGAVFGVDGLRAFFPLVAFGAALTGGFVFLIARRMGLSLPFALAAIALLFLPAQYFFGAFTHDGFLAQAVSTLFAVAMWWAITAWDDRPGGAAAVPVAIFLGAIFLSWPIWLGPPLLVFLALLLRRDRDLTHRQRPFAIVVMPLLALVLIHSWQRWGWMVIVRTSGAVLPPSIDSLGVLLPLLAIGGVVLGMSDRRARVTIVMLMVIALQAVTLFAIAKAQGASTPYMAFKMVYLAVYPLAILAAYALSRLSAVALAKDGPAGATRAHDAAGWLLATALVVVAVRPAITAPRAVPVVDADLYAAGQWVRANGGATCTDYLVADAETAYWLHLAVLGNPRSSSRMAEVDRYEPRAAVAPWISAEGRPYAIADLRLLPDEVRSRVTLLSQSGHAGVITGRRGSMKGCDLA